MVDYPVKFSSESRFQIEQKGWETKSPEGLKLEMAAPEEFGGSKEEPSPETLFCASLDSCVAATFKAIAERKGLNYTEVLTGTSAVLDRGEDSRPMIKEAEVDVEVKGVEEVEKAEGIAQATEKNCFIHHSIETEVDMSFDIHK